MARFVHKQKKELGVSPYELVFRGEKKTEHTQLRIIDFDSDNLKETTLQNIDEAFAYRNTHSVTWLNIDGVHNAELMQKVAAGFNINPLVLANVMNPHIRPKVEEHDNCLFISINMLQKDEYDTVTVENFCIVLTKNVLISFQERVGDVFEPIRERIRGQKRRIRNAGTDYLAFSLLDIIIDNYMFIVGELGEKIEDLDDNLLVNPSNETIDQINSLKRELNFLRKNINPAKEMILNLAKLDSDFIEDDNDVHFKELQNNISQAVESSDSYREILSDQLNIYHTTLSTKLNDIMKFLTIFSVIFIPLTFIAGIYGTNFDYLPELHFRYSYFVMWGVMAGVTLAMLYYFKRKNWF